MSHFVLVPGAWLGAWAWDRVVPLLAKAGHTSHAVTLSGLAERSDQAVGEITLDTHAADIAAAVAANPAQDLVLVSHSYSGMPVLQAVDALGDKVTRVVHVDSAVAPTGTAFLSDSSEWGRGVMAAIARDGGVWAPDSEQYSGQGFSDADLALLAERATPHPGGTLVQPLHLENPLSAVPTTYLHCLQDSPELDADTAALANQNRWEVRDLDAGHWPMLTAAELLADALVGTS